MPSGRECSASLTKQYSHWAIPTHLERDIGYQVHLSTTLTVSPKVAARGWPYRDYGQMPGQGQQTLNKDVNWHDGAGKCHQSGILHLSQPWMYRLPGEVPWWSAINNSPSLTDVTRWGQIHFFGQILALTLRLSHRTWDTSACGHWPISSAAFLKSFNTPSPSSTLRYFNDCLGPSQPL